MSKKPSITAATSRIFWQHTIRYRGTFLAIVFGIILACTFDIYRPTLYKQLFDLLANQGSTNPLTLAFKIAGAATLSWVGWRSATFGASYLQAKVIGDLTNTCFRNLVDHSYAFFHDNFAGSLVRRVNRYPDAYERMTDELLWTVFPGFLRLASVVVLLFLRQWELGVVILVWSLIYLSLNYWYALATLKYNVERAATDSATTGYLSDTVSNILNLKLFGGTERERRGFGAMVHKLVHLYWLTWTLESVAEAVQGALMVILEFVMLVTALHFWKLGRLTVGDFAMLQAYLIIIFDQLWNFGRTIKRIYRSYADSEEMTEMLLMEPGIRDHTKATSLTVTHGGIHFDHVHFGYTEQTVFNDFNLTVRPQEKLAIIGTSGGGKSTIVKLLFRFFDLQGGRITIDDQDIATVTQESLRAAIALVPQDPVLFHRSLRENIRYARPEATDEEVVQAAQQAHCHEFITQLPDGYDTFVGERGVKLSGGERQRVAIARAILKDAPILVLDEATSNLDSESELYIQDALRNLMREKTTIVIAHRLSTIRQMDRIVVLDGGQITEEGKHDELLKANQGIYQKLWEIQAGAY